MKRIKRVVAMALLLGLMATGGWASNCQASEDAGGDVKGVVTVTMAGPYEMMFSDVHQQRYLTYLIKEFSPEAQPEWEKAFAERKAASEKFGQVFKSSQDTITLSYTEKTSVKQGDVKFEVKPGQSGDGNTFVAESSMSASDKAQFDARIQLQKEFESAVQNNDPVAIKNVLPKVLVDYRLGTEDMLKAVVNAK